MLTEQSADIGTGHAERLIQQLDALFIQGDYTRNDISQIVCSTGPGSFTGVRVGLSAAKALAQALTVPLIGVTTLESLARDVAALGDPVDDFIIALDARRAQIYWQRFDHIGRAKTPPAISAIDDFTLEDGHALYGTGAPLLNADAPTLLVQATGSMPSMMRVAATKPQEAGPLVPLYLRSADAKQPKIPFAVTRQKGASA